MALAIAERAGARGLLNCRLRHGLSTPYFSSVVTGVVMGVALRANGHSVHYVGCSVFHLVTWLPRVVHTLHERVTTASHARSLYGLVWVG